MLMQPRPIAETSRPLLPSLRFCMISPSPLSAVLLVGDLLHPCHRLAVELFLNCDVCHCGGRCCPVPVLFAGREPNNIARADLLDCRPFPLRPAAACRDDQGLPKRVGMPRGSGAWLKSDAGADSAGRLWRIE